MHNGHAGAGLIDAFPGAVGSFAQRIFDFIPVGAVVILYNNVDMWMGFLDIIFSTLGYFLSPLLYSYHLTRIGQMGGSAIVVKSVTTNWRRLLTTLMLALFAMCTPPCPPPSVATVIA